MPIFNTSDYTHSDKYQYKIYLLGEYYWQREIAEKIVAINPEVDILISSSGNDIDNIKQNLTNLHHSDLIICKFTNDITDLIKVGYISGVIPVILSINSSLATDMELSVLSNIYNFSIVDNDISLLECIESLQVKDIV